MEKPDNHYKNCVIEPIDVIKKMLTHEQYKGFLLGNALKYRLRAGHKTEGDIEKAMQYENWYKESVTPVVAAEKKLTVGDLLSASEKDECAQLILEDRGYIDELGGCVFGGDADCDHCPLLDMTVTEVEQKASAPTEPTMQQLKDEGKVVGCPCVYVNEKILQGDNSLRFSVLDCAGIRCGDCPLYSMTASEIIAKYGVKEPAMQHLKDEGKEPTMQQLKNEGKVGCPCVYVNEKILKDGKYVMFDCHGLSCNVNCPLYAMTASEIVEKYVVKG